MLSEDCIVVYTYDVILIILVFLLQEAEKAKLDACLVLETLLVTDYFDSDHGLCHVIEAFECLSKATRAQLVKNFKSVG